MSARGAVLARLASRGVIDAARVETLAATVATPWWLALLQAVAAWIASLLLVSTFFAPLLLAGFGSGAAASGIGGVLLLIAAIWLFGRKRIFTDQMALAFSLAGQALVLSAFANFRAAPDIALDRVWLVGLLVSVVMLLVRSTSTHRTACALLACAHLGLLIGPGNGLMLYAVVLAALAVAAWLGRSHWRTLPAGLPVKPIAHALTLGALACGWLVGVEVSREAMQSLAGEVGPAGLMTWLYPAGAGAILLGAAGWLSRATAVALRGVVLGGATLFVIAAWQAPGLITSAALLLAVFHACHRAWTGLVLLAALLYLGEYYYSLQVTLLVKAGALAATGLVLLGLRLVLGRWRGRGA